jgi:hypothetical protein
VWTLILFSAAIAVWLAYAVNLHRNAELRERIARVRPLVRVLKVDDESKIAAVRLDPLWIDDNRWELYLPNGQFRVCIATREIGESGMPPIVQSARVGPGRHQLAFELARSKDGWHARAHWDEVAVLKLIEPLEWNPEVGSSGHAGISSSQQFDPEAPVVLMHSRFMKKDEHGGMSTPVGPADGVMLWIERVAEPTGQR